MQRVYLGDSYDLVKRFFGDTLRAVGPLRAHPRFVPAELREDFGRTTGILTLTESDLESVLDRTKQIGLLLDPDTGIHAPGHSRTRPTRKHVSLPFVEGMLLRRAVRYVVCFDQSHHRDGATAEKQRTSKLAALSAAGVHSLYYVSHAPFLFASQSGSVLNDIARALTAAGIPATRLLRNGPGTTRK